MKKRYFLILLIPIAWLLYSIIFSNPWFTDFEEAKKEAKASGKPILLYFSGSDWCGVCLRMKSEIFETENFKSYASENLVLMLADFPRMKKNKLDEKTSKQNESLAERYNPSGVFPNTILLNAEGKVLKEWNGFPNMKSEVFIDQIKKCK